MINPDLERATVIPPPHFRVSVIDIDMPFWSMVGFMLKWAFATIPALLVLGFIIGMLFAVMSSLLGL